MSKKTRNLAIAAAAASMLAAGSAQAQVPEVPGFFASATGLWMFNIGDKINAAGVGSVRPGNGPGFNLMMGYKFDSPWDVSLSGGAQWLRWRAAQGGGLQISTFATHQNLDLDAGYGFRLGADAAGRVFFGLRGYHYNQNVGLETVPAGAQLGVYRNVWGLGPKIGFGARTQITESIALMGSIDAALLYGRFNENTAGVAATNNNYSRLIPQVGAELGVQYRFGAVPTMAVTVGARIDASFNTAFTTDASTRGSLVEVGPFIRLSYNFHAPVGAPPPPEPPPVGPAKNYMVFFDFDRSTITATAAETIKKAATDAKAGRSTRIGVTGHADRSGADAYNMALSLRRANAVKDQLVREGLPATAITITGRGESQPLVQTADGVREPQNRRVEIVLQ